MHRIIYLSTAIGYLEKQEIESILKKSCVYNLEKNITGILLYIDRDFIQVLEGDKNDISTLFKKIKKDKRHKGIICVINETITQRQFSDWSMGYYTDSYQNLKNLSSFYDSNKKELFGYKDQAVAIFLNTFMKSHRFDIKQF
mgnify:CR=1 FL=1|tara:strand:+ start:4261 stop:4686 length:426 start_codon:yes stop_codon:yes gene_type:complete